MKRITRHQYLNKLVRLKGSPDIKIIVGMRRSGKSELLRAYKNYLTGLEEAINIVDIDLVDLSFDSLKDYKELHQYVESHYVPNSLNIVMIDEIQLCEKFALTINSLHNSGKYDIYLTGSNAFLLSSDLATLFTGRYIEIHVYPFSFAEYCQYFEIDDLRSDVLENYLIQGGLAGSYVYEAEEANAYIKNVYETIVKRDLVDKYNITEVALLDNITEFLMDNIGNLTTAGKMTNTLTSVQVPTNHVTTGNYLKYLCNAFLFYKVKRYDIKGKKYLSTNDKYYLSDVAIRYAILGKRHMDYGRAYENLVAIELLRRGYDIYVGKLYQKEIDFVALRGSEKTYIQVADDISNEKTFEREVSSLLSVNDAYPKIIIANTKHPMTLYKGIKVYDVARWLLGKEEKG